MRLLNEQRYCGWCGSEVSYTSTWASQCTGCNYRNFINPNPCNSIIVTKNDSVMMVRRAMEPKKGEYDIPGGYMEITDDSMESAALRELEEEVGLTKADVEKLEYLGSTKAPVYEWQETAIMNVCFYYVCKLIDTNRFVIPDQTENSEIIWVKKKDLDSITFAWDTDKIMLEQYFQKKD